MKRYLLALFFLSLFSYSYAQDSKGVDSTILKANTQFFLEHFANDSTNGYFIKHDSINGSTIAIRVKLTTKPVMGSVLEIFNPYESPFTYKAFIYNFKKKKYLEVSVYPVQPKMGVREMWPFPIENILIKQFKLEGEK